MTTPKHVLGGHFSSERSRRLKLRFMTEPKEAIAIVVDAIMACYGDLSAAAKDLEVSRRTIYHYIGSHKAIADAVPRARAAKRA
jgi:transcriptional regulator of acetoin/glycerol metabolism